MPDEKENKKDGGARALRGFISAVRPEMRMNIERGAEWLAARYPDDHWSRGGLAERVFTVVINEAEKKAEVRGGWLGTSVEAIASDASDIFGTVYFRKKKDPGTVLYENYMKTEGERFVKDAAERLRNAADKDAERERLKAEWQESMETRRFLKELSDSMKPPKSPRRPTDWQGLKNGARKRLHGTKRKSGLLRKLDAKATESAQRLQESREERERRLTELRERRMR